MVSYYRSFQGDTSVVVRFVLCFGVDFLCCLNLMYVFIVLVKFGLLSGRLLGRSLGLISVPNCQFVVFFRLGFWNGNFFLIAPLHVHCLLELSFDYTNYDI